MTPARRERGKAMNRYLLEAAAMSSTNTSIMSGRSRARQWSVVLAAAVALAALGVASVTAWLLVTDPVTASLAISTGDAEVILRVVWTALRDTLRILVRYL
jgi:anti-sigma-K factor RskA